MNQIVIVGAGPIGLLTAIKLKKLGLNIVIIDPRVEEYTRPGTIDSEIFQLLSAEVGETLNPSASFHIKDVERSLFQIAAKLGIEIKKASFEQFENNGVQIKFTNGSIKNLMCDLAIDATGSSRVLVNKINELEADSFIVQPIVDNMQKNYLIAYVKLKELDAKVLILNKQGKVAPSDLFRIMKLEDLRMMGWDSFVEPEISVRILNKNKVCLYVDVPPKLTELESEQWLQQVLALKTGNEYITFERIFSSLHSKFNKDKVRFNTFTVYPHKVNESYFMAPNRTVIPVGDARADAVFLIGLGIRYGIQQVNNLIKHIKIIDANMNFTIDFSLYDQQSKIMLHEYENEVITYYQKIQAIVKNSRFKQVAKYEEAIQSIAYGEGREQLELSYERLRLEIAMDLFSSGIKKFQDALINNAIKRDQYDLVEVSAELALEESVSLLSASLIFLNQDHLISLVMSTLKDIAAQYEKIAFTYFNLSKYGSAIRYYMIARDILSQDYFSDSNQKNVLQIQYMISQIYAKTNDYISAAQVIKEVDNALNHTDFEDQDLFLAKVKYHRAFVTFKILSTPKFFPVLTQEIINECKKDYLEIAGNKHVLRKELLVLKQLFDEVINKAQLMQVQALRH